MYLSKGFGLKIICSGVFLFFNKFAYKSLIFLVRDFEEIDAAIKPRNINLPLPLQPLCISDISP